QAEHRDGGHQDHQDEGSVRMHDCLLAACRYPAIFWEVTHALESDNAHKWSWPSCCCVTDIPPGASGSCWRTDLRARAGTGRMMGGDSNLNREFRMMRGFFTRMVVALLGIGLGGASLAADVMVSGTPPSNDASVALSPDGL